MKTPNVRLSLHRLLGVKVMEGEYNGRTEQGIWIPLNPNGISASNDRYFLKAFMTEKKDKARGQTHFLSLVFPKHLWSYRTEALENGFEDQIKYIGAVYNGFERYKAYGKFKGELDLAKAMNREE